MTLYLDIATAFTFQRLSHNTENKQAGSPRRRQ